MEPSLNNPHILSAATAVPSHRIEQGDTKEFARHLFAGRVRDLDRLLPVFDNGQIEARHSCQPLEWYGQKSSFPERNALYVEHALELSEKAACRCLDRAGVEPGEVGTLFFVSTTGISTPSLDAKLLFRLGTSPRATWSRRASSPTGPPPFCLVRGRGRRFWGATARTGPRQRTFWV